MKKLMALANLAWRFAVHCLALPFRRLRRGSGEERFRSSYEPDGFRVVDDELREQMIAFGRCVGCGLCEVAAADATPMEPRLASPDGLFRDWDVIGLPRLGLAAGSLPPRPYSKELLQAFAGVCPAGVPLDQLQKHLDKLSARIPGEESR